MAISIRIYIYSQVCSFCVVKVIFFYNLVDGISLLWKAHIVVLINLTLVLTSTYMRSFLSLETSQKMPTSRPPPAKSFCLWKRHNKCLCLWSSVAASYDHCMACIAGSLATQLYKHMKGTIQIPKYKMQNFYKSLVWCTKCSRKINRITQMDCKSRDESNECNYDVIRH